MSSSAAYDASNVTVQANGAQDLTGTTQGDDVNGDVVSLLNNTANSVATANASIPVSNPADGLLSQGYIIPSLMQVEKNFNGQGLIQGTPGTIDTGSIVSQTNPAFNSTLYAQYTATGGYAKTQLPDLTTQEPTTGASSYYGGTGGYLCQIVLQWRRYERQYQWNRNHRQQLHFRELQPERCPRLKRG